MQLLFLKQLLLYLTGAGIAQWLERRTRDRIPAEAAGLKKKLQGQLSVLTLISVSIPPPYYRSST